MNTRLAEAIRQTELAETRADDVIRSAGHQSAAWDAAEEAEVAGVPLRELLPLRIRLLRFAVEQWVPRAGAHAASLRSVDERAEWYRGIAGALNVAAAWHERAIVAGHIVVPCPLAEVTAVWDDEIRRFERAAANVYAS